MALGGDLWITISNSCNKKNKTLNVLSNYEDNNASYGEIASLTSSYRGWSATYCNVVFKSTTSKLSALLLVNTSQPITSITTNNGTINIKENVSGTSYKGAYIELSNLTLNTDITITITTSTSTGIKAHGFTFIVYDY